MNTSSTKSKKFTLIAVVALFLSAMTFSGCRTMEGAGKDIEKAGENLQDSAERNR